MLACTGLGRLVLYTVLATMEEASVVEWALAASLDKSAPVARESLAVAGLPRRMCAVDGVQFPHGSVQRSGAMLPPSWMWDDTN